MRPTEDEVQGLVINLDTRVDDQPITSGEVFDFFFDFYQIIIRVSTVLPDKL